MMDRLGRNLVRNPVYVTDDDDDSSDDTSTSSTSSSSTGDGKKRRERSKRKRKPRGVNFVVGYSEFWENDPIHAVIERFKKRYGLVWLRFSMSFKRFPNARQLYRADLDKKLNAGLVTKEYKTRDCNCRGSNLREGECIYGEECRKRCVVYKISCRHCKKFYIGNTSDLLKNRVSGHCCDACSLANKSAKPRSTALSRHCFTHLCISHPDGPPYGSRFSVPLVKSMLDVEVLWHCNGIRASKSFGKRECLLCNQERLYILKAMKSDEGKKLLLNPDLRLSSGCPHKTKFHLFDWEDQ
jgi:hypothetical protein